MYRGIDTSAGFSEGPHTALEVDVKGRLVKSEHSSGRMYSPILPAFFKAGDNLS